METDNPNDRLIPFYDNDEVIWITPPEYYTRIMGGVILMEVNSEL